MFLKGGSARVNGVFLPPSSGFAVPARHPTELSLILAVAALSEIKMGTPPIAFPPSQEYLYGWLNRFCACILAGHCKYICINIHCSFYLSLWYHIESVQPCNIHIWIQYVFITYLFFTQIYFLHKGLMLSQRYVLFLLIFLLLFSIHHFPPQLRVCRAQVDHMFVGSARVAGWEPACWESGPGQAMVWFDQQWDLECW